jgi:hypothetical protein
MRRIADRLGAWYTLLGQTVAVLGWAIGRDSIRFLAVLVIQQCGRGPAGSPGRQEGGKIVIHGLWEGTI